MLDASQILEDIIILTIYLSLPALLVGMVVGVFMGVLQATTSIQEAALAFVPKLFSVLIAIYLTFFWSAEKLSTISVKYYENISEYSKPQSYNYSIQEDISEQ